MKLYRLKYNGSYVFRPKPPSDAWERNVGEEVTITFSDDAKHIRLFPVGLPEDTVTLSLLESRIFRASSTASQYCLQCWFKLREPDRKLAVPDGYAEFSEGKAHYAEWDKNKASGFISDLSAPAEDEDDLADWLSDVFITNLLRSRGLLP
jgi:hypothetical protein